MGTFITLCQYSSNLRSCQGWSITELGNCKVCYIAISLGCVRGDAGNFVNLSIKKPLLPEHINSVAKSNRSGTTSIAWDGGYPSLLTLDFTGQGHVKSVTDAERSFLMIIILLTLDYNQIIIQIIIP